MKTHAEKAAERFDRWADNYGSDRISGWFRHYQKLALSHLNTADGGGFLDIGCGDGWAVGQVASRSVNDLVAGIDISPRMIKNARDKLPAAENVELRVANAESIPFPDATFRWVLCTFSFHHYANPDQALLEIRRVLVKGGRFVLLDSARDVSVPIWLQDRWRRYLEKSHVRYYTRAELRELTEGAGFRLKGEFEVFQGVMDHGKLFTGLVLLECEP